MKLRSHTFASFDRDISLGTRSFRHISYPKPENDKKTQKTQKTSRKPRKRQENPENPENPENDKKTQKTRKATPRGTMRDSCGTAAGQLRDNEKSRKTTKICVFVK